MPTLDPWGRLSASIAALGVPVDPGLLARARVFVTELRRWNRVGRLTGYRSEAQQVQHLIIESLLLLQVLPDPTSPLLDIGTGPGVPGLILKLARPEWDVVLVEANRRRANFLRHVLRSLGLADVSVYQARAEGLGGTPGLRSAFRTVTMRAVAAVDTALELARPFLRPDGHAVIPLAPKGTRGLGTVREARLTVDATALPFQRAFLIIGATEAGEMFHVERRRTPRTWRTS